MNPQTSPPGGSLPPPPDVCLELERRLRRETRGEVLFDAAARGRYATDASIYQIMPAGVFVPLNEGDVATAIDIARDLHVPVLARGGGTSQCGQTVGAALVIDMQQVPARACSTWMPSAVRRSCSRASCSMTRTPA